MKPIRLLSILLAAVVFAAGFAGCGAPPEGIALEIDRRYLEEITTLKIWAMTTQLSNGTAVSCQGLLDKKFSFDPATFSAEKEQTINASAERQSIELDNLKLGDKIFVAGGYADGDKDDSPQLFGCQQVKIEAGKKTFVSIVLIPYQ